MLSFFSLQVWNEENFKSTNDLHVACYLHCYPQFTESSVVSVLLKHTKVEVEAVRVKQPCLFSASWGKQTSCCHSQSMLLGHRLGIALSLPKRCARRTRARTVPKTLRCAKRKYNRPNAQVFFFLRQTLNVWCLKKLIPLSKLAKFPHNCQRTFCRSDNWCILRYWDSQFASPGGNCSNVTWTGVNGKNETRLGLYMLVDFL